MQVLEGAHVAVLSAVARGVLMLRQQARSDGAVAEDVAVIAAGVTVFARADVAIAFLLVEDPE